MSADVRTNDELDHIPSVNLEVFLIILLATIAGTFAAAVALPTWLPSLSQSLLGNEPKAYWYLSRMSGIVAYMLMWLSIALGITITNKMARVWPGGPAAVDVHQFASLLSFTFAIFHVLILLGDRYANYSLTQLATPFTMGGRQEFWIGLGQLGFYLMLPVTFSFYARRFIGYKGWRLIHYASFLIYIFVTIHGLWAGTDTRAPAILGVYAVTIVATYFLTMYRVLVSIRLPSRQTE